MIQTRVVPQAPRAPREKLSLGSKVTKAPTAPIADAVPAAIVVAPSVPLVFPLGRLRRATENVRHTRIDEGCEELADDLQAHGLLQSLIGYMDDWPYQTSEADPAAGTITVTNSHSGSVFLLSVVQIEGEE